MALAIAAPACGPVVDLPLGQLRTHDLVRSCGVDPRHVALLAECPDDWPPILVRGPEVGAPPYVVIDGAHRVAAARQVRMATIRAERFEGSPDEALVEAIQRNVRHGLPLTMVDRRAAATRLVQSHPDWSDRRLAEVCALSARTVARIRRSLPLRPVGAADRIGRDGKRRPAEPAAARSRVAAELATDATRSNREIAAVAGTSRETVRALRHQFVAYPEAPAGDGRGRWESDRALISSKAADRLLGWLRATGAVDEWAEFVDAIPCSRLYELADEARRRAGQWQAFARALEARAAPR